MACLSATAGIYMLLFLSACSQPFFPPKAVRDVDPTMQISLFSSEVDTYFKGHVAQVGGRIISVAPSPKGFLITAHELPLKDGSSPPSEKARPIGLFVFLFSGDIDPAGIQPGNEFVLIGEVEGVELVQADTVRRPVPFLLAHCLHVWKTGSFAIADFPHLPAGYSPLEQQTYCLPQWQ
jgi:starvation-inducible outer membrane lipoprotein